MTTITVLGAGMMGSSLCVPLADAGHDVRLVGTHLDEAIVQSLKADHVHPKLGLTLPASIRPYSVGELGAAMQGAELLLLGVSSAGVGWAGDVIAPFARPDLPVLMVSKGLVWTGQRLQVLPDVLAERVARAGGPSIAPAAVAGPCIAGELARRVATCVVFTGRDPQILERLKQALAGPYYYVWTNPDVVGVEACAALKNAYAMGIAFAIGMHERAGGKPGSIALHNCEAACFAQAIIEMQALVGAIGGDPRSVPGLPGVGDLDVTCNGGRTGRFGRLLGLGLTPAEAVAEMQGATLECLEILDVLERASPSLGLRLPLLQHMIDVALHGAPVRLPFDEFFQL